MASAPKSLKWGMTFPRLAWLRMNVEHRVEEVRRSNRRDGSACPVMPGFAALFFDQPDGVDPHSAFDGLDHVVDGETGDGDRGQRFHLDPGRAGDLDGGADGAARQLAV